jgi:hypothetical protein
MGRKRKLVKGRSKHGKFTDNLVYYLEELISEGLSDLRASQAVGISTFSFYKWKKEGGTYDLWECDCKTKREDINGEEVEVNKSVEGSLTNNVDKNYTDRICNSCGVEYRLKPSFAERVDKARANGIRSILQDFKKFTSEDWRAAADYLKTVFYKDFGKKVAVELTGRDGAPFHTVNIDLDKDSDVEAVRKYTDLVKALNNGGMIDEDG